MIIYKTTNTITGKIYIGQDGFDNPKYFGSGTYIKRSIKKHGKENFTKEILRICKDQKELDIWEKIFILKLKSTDKNIGYNIFCGSTNKFAYGSPMKGKHHSEEVRQKLSESSRGRRHSEETKKKIGIIHKGKHLSEETKQKLSVLHKGKKLSEETIEKMKGYKMSEENKRKMSERHKGNKYNLGRELSERQRLGIIESNKRRKMSEENKFKLIEKNRGNRYASK